MVPLEDLFEDIVGKAQRGLKIDDATLASRAEINTEQLRQLKSGKGDVAWIPGIATALNLDSEALAASYLKSWYPNNVPSIEGLLQFNTELLGMAVNAYLVWCPESKEAAIFDTGVDESKLLDTIKTHGLTVKSIFLTHTHEDHVALLDEIAAVTSSPIYSPEKEQVENSTPVKEGDIFKLGGLHIKARLTNGHSIGGITYVATGLAQPIAVVGDALFAGSMGGAPDDFANALRNNREKILSLQGDTILCPGHGPLTTVGNELEHNPFYK